MPADSGGIEDPIEEWSGPLLRDYVFTSGDRTMTLTAGGLTAFRGRELTLVVYALGPQSTEWNFGERNDVSTVTLAEANNELGLDPVATDQFQGRELRFNEQAFAAFDAVVASDGTVSWTIGPVPDEPGLNAFDGFQMLLTAEGEPPDTSTIEDWRMTHFGTSSNEGDAANDADPDGDGFKNLVEYALGTDPANPGEGFSAVSFGREGDFLTLTFDHIDDPSLTYRIEAANDLTGEWTVVETYTFTSAGTAVHEDTVPVGEEDSRFLRLNVVISE